jgi:hypothetical protein
LRTFHQAVRDCSNAIYHCFNITHADAREDTQ